MDEAPILIVGAGPSGMIAALDLAHFGIRSILLDEDHLLNEGSRAIAYSADTLAVWEKLGAAQAMLAKGVAWSVRHTFFRDRELFTQRFPLPAAGFLPRFFNLQQSYVERYLLDRIEATPLIKMCWDHKVTGFRQVRGLVVLRASTSTGEQEFTGQYVLACDGARSSMRRLLNLPFPGVTHRDHFIIADIRADLPPIPEPRFFFDHPANPGQTTLIHPQPDGVWRIDWQVGQEVKIEAEREPGRMDRRIRALIGDLPYEIVWVSDYRFHQRLLEHFRHGQIFFLGDAAHLVAPFGARGMNSAVADVDNMAWKLALVLNHGAPDSLLDSYHAERWPAQRHNQVVTKRTMRFMSPANGWQRLIRNLILRLSGFYTPARRQVDSGKMIEPYTYRDSPLIARDDAPVQAWHGAPRLGGKAPDAACSCWEGTERKSIFLRSLLGSGFVALVFAAHPEDGQPFAQASCARLPGLPVRVYTVVEQRPDAPFAGEFLEDASGALASVFAARPGTLYLIRPDGHIAARRRNARPEELAELLCQACGFTNQV